MAELDEILRGDPQPRDEHGRFAKSDAPPASSEPAAEAAPAPESVTPTPVAETPADAAPSAPPTVAPSTAPAPDSAPGKIPEAALLDERRKRQERDQWLKERDERIDRLERQLAELSQGRQAPQASPEPAAAPAELPADFWENPQAHMQAYGERIRTETLTAARHEQRELYARTCETIARRHYADYDEVRPVFLERLRQDPILQADFAKADDPAEFAYTQGKRLREMAEIGDPMALKRRVAELEAQLSAAPKPAAAAVQLPQSLNAESSAPSTVAPSGRTPLSALTTTKFA